MNATEREARKAAKEARQRARRASLSIPSPEPRLPVHDTLWLAAMQGDGLFDTLDRAGFSEAERRLFIKNLPVFAELRDTLPVLSGREFLYENLKAVRETVRRGQA
jgi:hypothetical protein